MSRNAIAHLSGVLTVLCFVGCQKTFGPVGVSPDNAAAGKASTDPDNMLVDGRPISAWAKDLKQTDGKLRGKASAAVVKLGPEAKPLVPTLNLLLKNESIELRITGALTIGRLGPVAKDAIPGLVANLKDPNQRVRLAIIGALGSMGDDAKPALPALREAIAQDPAPETEAAILDALGKIGPVAVPVVFELIRGSEGSLKQALGDVLAEIGKGSVDPILPGLKNADAKVREAVAYALWKLGPRARPALDSLGEAVRDSQSAVRDYAAQALTALGEPAVVPLAAALTSKESRPEANMALNTMARQGVELATAVPALIEVMLDPDAKVAQQAANTLNLQGVGPYAKGSADKLIEALKAKTSMVRTTAAVMLGGVGPEAEKAVPALLECLTHKESEMRSAAAKGLGRIGAKAAIEPLTKALKDPDPYVRRSAALALAAIGPEAKAAIPVLRQAMEDKQGYVYVAAAGALVRLSPEDSKAAMESLTKAAGDPNHYIRNVAVDALREVGIVGVPSLASRVSDADWLTRLQAVRALQAIGPGAKEAVPKLVPALKDRDAVVRRVAANALKAIDPDAAAKAGVK
jgi:HEAT repeat protein